MDIALLLDNCIFLNLLVLTIIYWAILVFPKFKFLSKVGFYGNAFANLLLFILLFIRWVNYGYFPLSNLYESLLFLAWGITFTTLVLERRSNFSIVGAVSTPIALFVSGFAALSLPEEMQLPSPLVPALKSNWLMMHVTVMMLSYANLIVGSLLAILLLVLLKTKNATLQEKYNRRQDSNIPILDTAFYQMEPSLLTNNMFKESEGKEITLDNRLSLIESIDNLSYRTISFGFPLLTIGIIAGAVWANEAWGSYWSWDPKETWALITWLVFAAYLHARITKS